MGILSERAPSDWEYRVNDTHSRDFGAIRNEARIVADRVGHAVLIRAESPATGDEREVCWVEPTEHVTAGVAFRVRPRLPLRRGAEGYQSRFLAMLQREGKN